MARARGVVRVEGGGTDGSEFVELWWGWGWVGIRTLYIYEYLGGEREGVFGRDRENDAPRRLRC